MATSDVPPGIDYDAVARYFAANIPGGGVPLTFNVISGGRSNLTYRVSGGGHEWVLRRPPLGHVLPTAHDMAREFRVLTALTATSVPAPRTFALCEDTSVNEYPFYVMEYLEGIVIEDRMPAGWATSEEERRRLSLAYVDAIVRLHNVDPAAAGLADFGRPEGFLARQIRRWAEQWERSKTAERAEVYELQRRLQASIPEPQPPAIVHGDYRLGNVMLAHDDPGRVVAVLDWEMATLGDPMTDVGWMLLTWHASPGERPQAAELSWPDRALGPGFLRRAEVQSEYERLIGRSLANAEWYTLLALYKLAVINEGIWARYLMGQTVGEGFERNRVPALLALGMEMAAAADDPRLRGIGI